MLSDRRIKTCVSVCVLLYCAGPPLSFAGEAEISPLVRVVDLKVGETQRVELSDGTSTTVRLLAIEAERDAVMGAVHRALAVVEIDGTRATIESGNYRLPMTVGRVQIDCPLTRHYNDDSTADHWGLTADARLRMWPKSSDWIRPGSFVYPIEQELFATMTWFSNEPVSKRSSGKIYYHAGMDIGGTENLTEVLAATDGVVVSAGEATLDADHPAVAKRYDVVYVRDRREWYYRYSHLARFADDVKVGEPVEAGQRLGWVGKEGASGGWTHLHFEIKSLQPSGQWGTQDSYAFLWQAYHRQYAPAVVAIARPIVRVRIGQAAHLDASRSWAAEPIAGYEWTFEDGSSATGPKVIRRYDRPGMYNEILKVTDAAGNIDYDFATVRVADGITGRPGPRIDANFHPSLDVHPGDEVTFTSRGFDDGPSTDVWDFGDGTEPVRVESNVDSAQHADNGYAVTTHRFEQPGDYIVSVRKQNDRHETATKRLHVRVTPR